MTIVNKLTKYNDSQWHANENTQYVGTKTQRLLLTIFYYCYCKTKFNNFFVAVLLRLQSKLTHQLKY